MPTARIVSAFADPPVYAAGHGAGAYAVPGAATRAAGESVRVGRFAVPALWFAGGVAAGAAVAYVLTRALAK